ncbi:MAG: Flp pilus assembly complex ATPase component TadA [Candidatus Omnitrophota bacterium]|nr:MAG: Flp pilus assembly complex ATPase component TadA [Candidatus Omnitrophota bacterium]
MAKSLKEQLVNILTENKLLTPDELDKALDIQKQKGGRLSSILVSLNLVDERDLMIALSKSLHIPPVNLEKLKIKPEVIKLIPQQVAQHYQLIPVSRIGDNLTVAVSDPLNIVALDDIRALTKYKVKTVLSTEVDIKEAIRRYYSADAQEIIKDAIERRTAVVTEPSKKKEEELDTESLMELVKGAPLVKITNMILEEGIKRRASDILIEPLEKIMQVRYRVDGVLQMGQAPPKSMHEAIVTRIKVMSRLNVAEHRLPQDGRFKYGSARKQEVDFRVSVLPSSFGEKLALRILDKSTLLLDLEKLGFEETPLKVLKECTLRPHGMILICGPTGCGKTTTLYSILKRVDSIEKNLVTVEDPIEYQLDGINQVTALPEIGLTFANALRSILRQDPDVIMIGEIRDYDTVDIAIKSALTGHLVLSTLHTTDAAGSLVRLANMGVEPFLITASVLMVGAQRLVRLLCPDCKEAYKVSPALKEKLNLKDNKELTFYRPKGCPKCNNTGYKGRIAIMEILRITPKIKDLIAQKAPEVQIKNAARREGMTTLRENGLAKVIRGETSLEEVLRVTVPDEKLS